MILRQVFFSKQNIINGEKIIKTIKTRKDILIFVYHGCNAYLYNV